MSIDPAASTMRAKERLLDTVRIINDEAQIPVNKLEPSNNVAYDSEKDPRAKTRENLKRAHLISEPETYSWRVDRTRSTDRAAIRYDCQYPFLLRERGTEYD
ncbi:hypothetical protein M406DRAFT_326790 [Cryphonectria parasitica EP155]|uniref:Uncharacterized protein n=1 Tax=Cryphonectria parasitica (strain ATCC 38755 / EP155) TaxID=660469 RepID=A0A9P4YEI9_CRYP1|nr:uncharacterized protein M406DRAFT_326790 [Cryphonectria parasitica EP155]KAF3771415.1 hypothetical protein M406DRAFT_326790 [Cryphonectria parasitica EP155]